MIAWILLGLLPMLAQMFGGGFVPSTEWASTTRGPGLVAGLGTVMLWLWSVWSADDWPSRSDLSKFGAALGVLLLGFMTGKNIVDVTGPMAIALVAGGETELQFTVERADSFGPKGCRSQVELQGLPLLFDSACGVPSDFRDSLTPGTRVVVSGRGTSLGVYARYMRRAD
ncbi:hypothetical protein [Aminobacter sp. BE322]|uniref:hypothetical protein n=1 Tax=unclassified Aminobacter TaxID=2644704 RepID=UPI003D21E24B